MVDHKRTQNDESDDDAILSEQTSSKRIHFPASESNDGVGLPDVDELPQPFSSTCPADTTIYNNEKTSALL